MWFLIEIVTSSVMVPPLRVTIHSTEDAFYATLTPHLIGYLKFVLIVIRAADCLRESRFYDL